MYVRHFYNSFPPLFKDMNYRTKKKFCATDAWHFLSVPKMSVITLLVQTDECLKVQDRDCVGDVARLSSQIPQICLLAC